MQAASSKLIASGLLLRLEEEAKDILRERGGGEGRVRLGQLSLRAPSLKASPPPPPPPPTPDVELDLQRSVQAVLRELSAQAPALQSNRGKNQQASSVRSVGSPPTPSSPQPALPMRSRERAPTRSSKDEGGFQPLAPTLLEVPRA